MSVRSGKTLPLRAGAWLLALVVGAASVGASEGWLDPVRLLDAQGQTRRALDALEAQLARRSPEIEAELLHGVLLAKLGRTTEARELFQRLIREQPERPEAYNNLAVMYAAAGDYDSAIEILKQGLGTHPSYRTTYDNLSRVYGKLASEAYSEALGDERIDAEPLRLALINTLGDSATAAAEPVRTAEVAPPEPEPVGEAAPAALSAEPAAAAAVDDSEAIWKMVQAWAAAWAGQSTDVYLSFYAAEFQPADGSPRAEWERLRRSRLATPQRIEILLALLDVEQERPGRATARFVQSYESDRFSDTVTKALDLVVTPAGWKILRETVETAG